MGFLRLGVACAVWGADGRILLSKRGDLNVWNLPSGRLDSSELLATAAVREVYEETGIEAEIKQVVGLYYYEGWQRMQEKFGRDLRGKTINVSWAYASSYQKPISVPQSLVLLMSRFGMNVRLTRPPEYKLMPDIVEQAKENTKKHGALDDAQATAFVDGIFHRAGTDWVMEGTRESRERWHNLKYYTWVEQQGKTVEELDAQRDPEWWLAHQEQVAEIDKRLMEERSQRPIAN